MELSEFVASFSKKVNLPGLELDNDDYCAFTIDDMPVHLQGIKEKDQVLVYGDMGDLPAERDEAFFLALLQMNYLFSGTRGGTIAYQKDSERVILELLVHNFSKYEEEEIYNLLEEFANSLEELRNFMENYRANAATVTETVSHDDYLNLGLRI